jgi:hypothetical protein
MGIHVGLGADSVCVLYMCVREVMGYNRGKRGHVV